MPDQEQPSQRFELVVTASGTVEQGTAPEPPQPAADESEQEQ